MKPILFHPDADREASEAAEFYRHREPGLGKQFRQELSAAVNRVTADPESFAREFESDYRICQLNRFPYLLWFTVDEDVIFVIAVSHQRRRPGYWRERR